MRTAIILSLLVAVGAVVWGCNSQEGSANRGTKPLVSINTPQTQPTGQPQPVHNPSDDARRITADELYKLWEKHEVLIVDTRNEATFNQSHIKGAILIPSNEFASRINELPKDKLIATYCT
jgi:predicted sulfurtransferase